jgi:hypothetical protein
MVGEQVSLLFGFSHGRRTNFSRKIPGISISFTRDTKHAVTGLVLHQNGNHAAPKMSDAELLTEPDYQRGG